MVVFLLRVDSMSTALVFALVWGAFSGPIGFMKRMVLAQYFGRKSYGTITGIIQPFSTFSLGLGSAAATILVTAVGRSGPLYLVFLAVQLASVICVFLAGVPARPKKVRAVPIS